MSTHLDWKKKNFTSVWKTTCGCLKLSVRPALNNGFFWMIEGFTETISGTRDLPILAMEAAEAVVYKKILEIQADFLTNKHIPDMEW